MKIRKSTALWVKKLKLAMDPIRLPVGGPLVGYRVYSRRGLFNSQTFMRYIWLETERTFVEVSSELIK